MPRIVLARTFQHEQVDFPEGTPAPEGRRGGATGSLHLRRNRVRDVTAEELEIIKETRPDLFKACDILPEPRVSKRALKAAAKAEAKAAKAAAKASEPADEAPTPTRKRASRKRS